MKKTCMNTFVMTTRPETIVILILTLCRRLIVMTMSIINVTVRTISSRVSRIDEALASSILENVEEMCSCPAWISMIFYISETVTNLMRKCSDIAIAWN